MKKYKVIVSDYSLGGYRWADNETLKVTSLQNLIHSDYLFAQYRYSCSAFSWLWGKLFRYAELNESIRYKIETGNRKQLDVSPEILCKYIQYHRANPVVLILYKAARKIYIVGSRTINYLGRKTAKYQVLSE